MPKFYVSSGTLNIIVSKSDPLEASTFSLLQVNKNDIIDEYFYVDESGFRNYISADSKTSVIATKYVIKHNMYETE